MTPNNLKTIDLSPAPADFLADALRGLSQPQKSLEPKYFYDAKGSSLFNEICLLPEYYVTRTELGVMATLERFSATTEGLAIIELGGADSFKFRRLLDVVDDINMYIAVDISKEALLESTRKLAPGHTLEIISSFLNQTNSNKSDHSPLKMLITNSQR